jgi:hypothetical protein
MNYTLITSKGKVYTFFIKELAQTYQQAFGGVLMEAKEFGQVEVPVIA